MILPKSCLYLTVRNHCESVPTVAALPHSPFSSPVLSWEVTTEMEFNLEEARGRCPHPIPKQPVVILSYASVKVKFLHLCEAQCHDIRLVVGWSVVVNVIRHCASHSMEYRIGNVHSMGYWIEDVHIYGGKYSANKVAWSLSPLMFKRGFSSFVISSCRYFR